MNCYGDSDTVTVAVMKLLGFLSCQAAACVSALESAESAPELVEGGGPVLHGDPVDPLPRLDPGVAQPAPPACPADGQPARLALPHFRGPGGWFTSAVEFTGAVEVWSVVW